LIPATAQAVDEELIRDEARA